MYYLFMYQLLLLVCGLLYEGIKKCTGKLKNK